MKKWSYIITWVVSLDRDNLEAFEEIDSVHLKYGLIRGKRLICRSYCIAGIQNLAISICQKVIMV
jgi:hypothetical protein